VVKGLARLRLNAPSVFMASYYRVGSGSCVFLLVLVLLGGKIGGIFINRGRFEERLLLLS